MGKKKKKLSQQERVAVIQGKEEQKKKIIAALSQQRNLPALEHMNSVKDMGQQNKTKKQRPAQAISEQESSNSENVDSEDSASEPQLEKKVKTESDQQNPLPVVNIFQQMSYSNVEQSENVQAARVSNDLTKKSVATYKEQYLELEIAAKRAFPEWSLEVFEGKKTSQQVQKEEVVKNTKSTALEGEEQEEVVDKDLLEWHEKISSKIHFKRPQVQRSEECQVARKKLPIYYREDELLEAVNSNLITLVCGATGSGKSTQVPQFLYESGLPGVIGVTQPRRLAAISLARRVAEELGTRLGETVTYQVRHAASAQSESSKIKFMTDGILLNELATDFLLQKYSVIVVDEAHERKVNTDLLLGLLSRVVNVRKRLALGENGVQQAKEIFPLRVVIMSATLRLEDFTQNKYLFPQQRLRLVNVEARQFPVNIYFNRHTPDDYIEEAVRKCAQIHKKLPPGDILVFLTGEREIREFCVTLEQRLRRQTQKLDEEPTDSRALEDADFALEEQEEAQCLSAEQAAERDTLQVIAHAPLESEGVQKGTTTKHHGQYCTSFKILPLYSKLSMEEQERVFAREAAGNAGREEGAPTRLIVAATNVAETSLTIPNIKYVVDCGHHKKKVYSSRLSLARHIVTWISQASAEQRTGRAGRTCAGYCYRLYAPSVYANLFEKYSEPEILNMPLDAVILHLKAAGIEDVAKFPYPTRPKASQLNKALTNLLNIGAVAVTPTTAPNQAEEQDEQMQAEEDSTHDKTRLTEIGKVLAMLPIDPKYGKMLLLARRGGVLPYVLYLVSVLSVEELFEQTREQQLGNNSAKELSEDDDEGDMEVSLRNAQIKALEKAKEQRRLAIDSKRKEIARFRERYGQFMQGRSDLFVGMNIVGEFISAIGYQDKQKRIDKIDSDIAQYAKSHGLLTKSLKEIYHNLNQLLDLVDALLQSEDERKALSEALRAYKKPSPQQQCALEEIIIATFIGQVARRVTVTVGPLNVQKVVYETCEELREHLTISTHSFLAGRRPEFVCYTHLLETSKKYMMNVTEIQNIALMYRYDFCRENNTASLQYLNEPPPFFSQSKDELVVFAKVNFGPQRWELPRFEHTFQEESIEKYTHFARQLLLGNVIDFFKALKKTYKKDPSVALKLSSVAYEVQSLVNRLKNNEIDSAAKLKKKWSQDGSFLIDEVLLWVDKKFHESVRSKWPGTIASQKR